MPKVARRIEQLAVNHNVEVADARPSVPTELLRSLSMLPAKDGMRWKRSEDSIDDTGCWW